jgi:hypothetical protein
MHIDMHLWSYKQYNMYIIIAGQMQHGMTHIDLKYSTTECMPAVYVVWSSIIMYICN